MTTLSLNFKTLTFRAHAQYVESDTQHLLYFLPYSCPLYLLGVAYQNIAPTTMYFPMQTSLKWRNSGVGRQEAAEEGTAHLADESSLQISANYNNWRSRFVSNKKVILKIDVLTLETHC